MSYVALDFDAMTKAAMVSARAGVHRLCIIGGLAELWRYCWLEKTDAVTSEHLAGIFELEDGSRLATALALFGFLEASELGWRVRGADRYLRIHAAQSKGGHAARSNLIPGGPRAKAKREAEAAQALGSVSAGARLPLGSSREEPSQKPRLDWALTPNTEHRTQNTKEGGGAQTVDVAPERRSVDRRRPPPLKSPGLAFFERCQEIRTKAGAPKERPPANPLALPAWWARAKAVVGDDEARLEAAWEGYMRTAYWAAKRWPWAGFAAQWEEHLPSSVPPREPAKCCERCGAAAAGDVWGIAACRDCQDVWWDRAQRSNNTSPDALEAIARAVLRRASLEEVA